VSKLNKVTELPREPELRRLLRDGVAYWIGPIEASDEVAALMGCRNASAMTEEMRHLDSALGEGHPLTTRDVMRALLATELAWASALYGDPTDWENITGRTDEETLGLLRQLQATLSAGGVPLRLQHPFAQ
jgi:hypothetical protein